MLQSDGEKEIWHIDCRNYFILKRFEVYLFELIGLFWHATSVLFTILALMEDFEEASAEEVIQVSITPIIMETVW